jgi:hypothetical protein
VIVKENKRRMKKSGKKFKNATENSRNIVFNALGHAHKKLQKNSKNIQVAFSRIRTQCCNNFNISANDNSG